jgi:hypothetical protein
MNELIKEIKRQLNYVEQEKNKQQAKIENAINDTYKDYELRKELYFTAQINAYNNILDYIKQEELS